MHASSVAPSIHHSSPHDPRHPVCYPYHHSDLLEVRLGCLLPAEAGEEARLAMPSALKRSQKAHCSSAELAGQPMQQVVAARKALLQWSKASKGQLDVLRNGGQITVTFRTRVVGSNGSWHSMVVNLPAAAAADEDEEAE